jgi:SnoaL-like domain
MSTPPRDYEGLMQANLTQVFGERDTSRRLKAIAELYAPDATLYEPDSTATGHAAISQVVATLLSSLPPNFAFTAIGPAVGHHGVGRLRWQASPPNGPVAVTGAMSPVLERVESKPCTSFLTPLLSDPPRQHASPPMSDSL